MMNKTNNRPRRMVFAAILAALSFVILYVGTALGVLDLTAVVLAAFCSMLAVTELGSYYPVLILVVTSTLSFLLLPDKFVGVEYILFGGLYPILKPLIEKLPKIPSWILKFVYFNTVLTGAILVAKFIMALPDDYGMTFSPLVYLFANVFFILSDICMSLLHTMYTRKYRKLLKIDRLIQ